MPTPDSKSDLRGLPALSAALGSVSLRDPFDEDEDEGDPTLDPDWCDRCQGHGKVTTEDYESYFGACYKPCPVCGGDPCYGEPPLS